MSTETKTSAGDAPMPVHDHDDACGCGHDHHHDHNHHHHHHGWPVAPFVRPGPKIGRNDPCPCGSGKKYKKCCLKSD